MIRRETGDLKRFGGFIDGSETFAGRWVPGLLALYTELQCEHGMTRALNRLLNRNLGDRLEDAQWPMELVFMVEAALELSNREAVHALRPFVSRYAGKNLVAGQFVALFGSADRYLANGGALWGRRAASGTSPPRSRWTAGWARWSTSARRWPGTRCSPRRADAPKKLGGSPAKHGPSPARSARPGSSTWRIRCSPRLPWVPTV